MKISSKELDMGKNLHVDNWIWKKVQANSHNYILMCGYVSTFVFAFPGYKLSTELSDIGNSLIYVSSYVIKWILVVCVPIIN